MSNTERVKKSGRSEAVKGRSDKKKWKQKREGNTQKSKTAKEKSQEASEHDAQKQAAVADSFLDMEEKEMGIADALEEIQAEIKEHEEELGQPDWLTFATFGNLPEGYEYRVNELILYRSKVPYQISRERRNAGKPSFLVSGSLPTDIAPWGGCVEQWFTPLAVGEVCVSSLKWLLIVNQTVEDDPFLSDNYKQELLHMAFKVNAHLFSSGGSRRNKEFMSFKIKGFLERYSIGWQTQEYDISEYFDAHSASYMEDYVNSQVYKHDQDRQTLLTRAYDSMDIDQNTVRYLSFVQYLPSPKVVKLGYMIVTILLNLMVKEVTDHYLFEVLWKTLTTIFGTNMSIVILFLYHVLLLVLFAAWGWAHSKLGEAPVIKMKYNNIMTVSTGCQHEVPEDDLPPVQKGCRLDKGREWAKPCKHKDYVVYGCTFKQAEFAIPTPCVHSLYNSFRKRKVFERTYDPSLVRDIIENFKGLFNKMSEGVFMPTIDESEWLFHLTPRRRNIMLDTAPILTDQSYKTTSFVKGEAYIGKNLGNMKERDITVRAPEFQRTYGPWFYALGKWIKVIFGPQTNAIYDSGIDGRILGDIAERCAGQGFLYEADVSSWDGSLVSEWYDLELWIIDQAPISPPEKEYLLKTWKLTKGTGKGMKYKMAHGRRSGDLWTSMFNSVINIAITLYFFPEAVVLVKGDDNIMGLPKQVSAEDITSKYASIGMKVEVFERTLDTLGYCSGYFWRTDSGRVWGVNPFKVITKFGINWNNHSPKIFKRLIKGTAISMLPIAAHVPLIGSMLKGVVDNDVIPVYPEKEFWKNTCSTQYDLSPFAFQQLAEVSGVSAEVLWKMDKEFSTVKLEQFPILFDSEHVHTAFAKMFSPQTAIPIKIEEPPNEVIPFIVGPVLEEIVCKVIFAKFPILGWILRLALIVYEGHDPFSINTLIHLTCQYLNTKKGLVLHFLFNLFVRTQNNHLNMTRNNKRNKKRGKKNNNNGISKSSIKSMIGNAIRAVGSGAGGYFGGSTGKQLGYAAGDFVSKITGFGDYKISSNTLLGSSVPQFKSDGRTARVCHREFLTDIKASHDFKLMTYELQPGLKTSFPWISGMADLYQQFRIHGMVFYFRSLSAAWDGTGLSLGAVIMGTQYDVLEMPFQSKIEMENYEFSNSAKPSVDQAHPIECDPSEGVLKNYFLRTGEINENDDLRFHDFGNFQIATVGMDEKMDDETIGELWVSYDIEFLKPRVSKGAVHSGNFFRYRNIATGLDVFGAGGTIEGDLPITIGGADTNTFYFDERIFSGRFFVNISAYRSDSPAVPSGLAVSPTNGVLLLEWPRETGTGTVYEPWFAENTTGTASFSNSMSFVMDVTSSPCSVIVATFGGPLWSTGAWTIQLRVVAIPSDY